MDSAYNVSRYLKKGKTLVLTLKQGEDDVTEARTWTDKDINLLMKQVDQLLPEFVNPKRTKKDVWEEVAKEQQNHGNPRSAEDCRKKWSNMIRTFKAIEEQRQDTTEGKGKRVRWMFFEQMHQILSREGADGLPEAAGVSDLLRNTFTPLIVSSNIVGGGTRKSSKTKHTSTSSSFPVEHSPGIAHSSSSFLDSHQSNSLQLGGTTDMISLAGSGFDSSPFSDNSIRFFKSEPHLPQPAQDQLQPQVVSIKAENGTVPPASASHPSRKKVKRRVLKKTDDLSEGFLYDLIEGMKTQNETMQQRLNDFHTNVINLMQERNEVLKEIRDNLKNDSSHTSNHNAVESVEANASSGPTFHMGPAYSINPTDTGDNITSNPNGNPNTTVVSVPSMVNDQLELSQSNSGVTSIPTCQLVQGHDDGAVLANYPPSTSSNNGDGKTV